jgi:hypothetical protein
VTRATLLTRVMALAAWMCVASAVLDAVLPVPESVLGILLVGAGVLLRLRTSGGAARHAGLVAAVLFFGVRAALAVARSDPDAAFAGPAAMPFSPVLRDGAVWGPALVGAVLVAISPRVAAWVGLEAGGSRAAMRRVERALGGAAGPGADVSLALLGLDASDAAAMSRLDESLAVDLAPSDSVAEYGPLERLVVLRGVSAAELGPGAARLCAVSTGRTGRPVRAALATIPAGRPRPRHLLDRLDLALAICRSAGATVAWAAGADGSERSSLPAPDTSRS